jgi:hypothetical protein
MGNIHFLNHRQSTSGHEMGFKYYIFTFLWVTFLSTADTSRPRDKTSETVGTKAPRRVLHMLHRNLCIMQMGKMRDFMTCAKLPSSAACMDTGVLSFRAVIIAQ